MDVQNIDQPSPAVSFMKYDREVQLIGDFKLPNQPSFLIVLRGVHPVVIQPDFSPGANFGISGKRADRL